MSIEIPLTCIHSDAGLCKKCREEYEADPLAYLEFGQHPEGIKRWEQLEEEMCTEARKRWHDHNIEYSEEDIPF